MFPVSSQRVTNALMVAVAGASGVSPRTPRREAYRAYRDAAPWTAVEATVCELGVVTWICAWSRYEVWKCRKRDVVSTTRRGYHCGEESISRAVRARTSALLRRHRASHSMSSGQASRAACSVARMVARDARRARPRTRRDQSDGSLDKSQSLHGAHRITSRYPGRLPCMCRAVVQHACRGHVRSRCNAGASERR